MVQDKIVYGLICINVLTGRKWDSAPAAVTVARFDPEVPVDLKSPERNWDGMADCSRQTCCHVMHCLNSLYEIFSLSKGWCKSGSEF